jgi:hypothetical protein
MPDITHVGGIGFGKEAPGYNNPAAYMFGTLEGEEAMYRSLDLGMTWEKVSDEVNTLGDFGSFVAGDSRTFGVVYAGSDGRGIYIGMPKGTVLEVEKETGSVSFDGIPRIYYNGERLAFANKPLIRNGVPMAPVRELLKYFGVRIEWDYELQLVRASRTELDVRFSGVKASGALLATEVVFTPDSNTARVNGVEITMPSSAVVINGTMYVPVVSAAQAFGAKAERENEVSDCFIEDSALIMY